MPIRLVLGLGNPGPEYAETRHNVGFMVADELRRRLGPASWLLRSDCEIAVVVLGRLVVLGRPLGFMNRSGVVAERLLHELAVTAEELLVVSDDIDLPLGRLRLRPSGGAGSHNGLRDVCAHVGEGYARLRVGVSPASPGEDLADYVLSPFSADERSEAAAAVRRAADAVELAARTGLEQAMNLYNRPPESAGG